METVTGTSMADGVTLVTPSPLNSVSELVMAGWAVVTGVTPPFSLVVCSLADRGGGGGGAG